MFFVLLCVACFQDIRMRKISNLLVLSVAVTGGFYCFSIDGWPGVFHWFARVLVYGGVLYPLYKMGGLGAGDVKLMAVLEGVFSWSGSVTYFICVWFLAGLTALLKMLSQGNFLERMEYFFSYITEVAVTGKWQFYYRERAQGLKKDRTICMSVPLIIGFALCMGG